MALRVLPLQPEIAEQIAREIERTEQEREIEQSHKELAVAVNEKRKHDRLAHLEMMENEKKLHTENAGVEMVPVVGARSSTSPNSSTSAGDTTDTGSQAVSSSFVSGLSSVAANFLGRSAPPDPRGHGPQLLAKGGPKQLIVTDKKAQKLALDETVFRELIETLKERDVDRIIPVCIVGAAREGTVEICPWTGEII